MITSVRTVPLLRMARYRSISVFPPSALSARAGASAFATEAIPSRPPRRSAFSAGNTDAPDLYHLGRKSVMMVTRAVTPRTNQEMNRRYLVTMARKLRTVADDVCDPSDSGT